MQKIELLKSRAECNDIAAMVDLGLYYLREEGSVHDTIHWWEKAANAGNVKAIHNLVGLYADPEVDAAANSEEFLKWLKMLVYYVKDGKAMVILGALLSGNKRGHIMWRRAFEPRVFEKYKDVDEAFRLIEEALALESVGQANLDRYDYDAISNAYYFRSGGFSNGDVSDLRKALKYREKVLSLMPHERQDLCELTRRSINDLKRIIIPDK